MNKLTTPPQELKGVKEPQKRIKVFCDFRDTINLLSNPFEMEEEEKSAFFESLKKMEVAYKSKLDITIVSRDAQVSNSGNATELWSVFNEFEFVDRLTGWRGLDGFFTQENGWNTDVKNCTSAEYYLDKAAAIQDYENRFEKDKENILFNLYIGDNGGHGNDIGQDFEMAKGHTVGQYYKGKPCAFLHVPGRQFSHEPKPENLSHKGLTFKEGNLSFVYKNGVKDNSMFDIDEIPDYVQGVTKYANIITSLAKNNQLELPSKADTKDDK